MATKMHDINPNIKPVLFIILLIIAAVIIYLINR